MVPEQLEQWGTCGYNVATNVDHVLSLLAKESSPRKLMAGAGFGADVTCVSD